MATPVIGQPDIAGLREQIKENIALALGPDNRFEGGFYLNPTELRITTFYHEEKHTAAARFLHYSERPIMTGLPKNTLEGALESLLEVSGRALHLMRSLNPSAGEYNSATWMDVAVQFVNLPELHAAVQARLAEEAFKAGIVPSREAGMAAFVKTGNMEK